MSSISISKTPRVNIVDALCGFAVMAILIIHSVEHYIYPVYPDKLMQPEWLNALDSVVFNVVFSLIAGKGYSIFALLFGFTYFIQLTNQQKKGNDFSWRFIWRLLLLALFATLNAAFFPGGDVLLLFVFTGISLVLVRNMSNTAVVIIAIICLMQPIELFYFVNGLINKSFALPDLGVGQLYETVQEGVKSGSWSIFLTENMTTGQKASLFWAIGGGRFVQTIGLFLLGFLMSRKQLFSYSATNIRIWVKLLIASSVLFGILYPLKVEWYDNASSEIVKSSIGTALDMWQKLAYTFVIVSAIVIAYYHGNLEKYTNNIRIYGRMSLTNYVTQSIIGALIFFPIGLNLAPYLGFTASLLVGLVVIVFQIYCCKLWLKIINRDLWNIYGTKQLG